MQSVPRIDRSFVYLSIVCHLLFVAYRLDAKTTHCSRRVVRLPKFSFAHASFFFWFAARLTFLRVCLPLLICTTFSPFHFFYGRNAFFLISRLIVVAAARTIVIILPIVHCVLDFCLFHCPISVTGRGLLYFALIRRRVGGVSSCWWSLPVVVVVVVTIVRFRSNIRFHWLICNQRGNERERNNISC